MNNFINVLLKFFCKNCQRKVKVAFESLESMMWKNTFGVMEAERKMFWNLLSTPKTNECSKFCIPLIKKNLSIFEKQLEEVNAKKKSIEEWKEIWLFQNKLLSAINENNKSRLCVSHYQIIEEFIKFNTWAYHYSWENSLQNLEKNS